MFLLHFAFFCRVQEGNKPKSLHLVGARNGVAMSSSNTSIIEKLDENDRDKIEYFAKLLLNQSKYKKIKNEIEKRRKEIEKDEILSHDDFWKGMNA